MTCIVFPSEPYDLRQLDPEFADERAACASAGLVHALLDHTRLTAGDVAESCDRLPAADVALYRGWMLRVSEYAAFHAAAKARGAMLVNDPEAYRFCHHLPVAYPVLEGATPRSVWLPLVDANAVDFDAVHSALQPFGRGPIVVKDYVKSQKHYWNEACFIPDASDRARVECVTRRFLELQAENLAEGLVFRELVDLEPIGVHPRSGMPLGAEVRTFWLDGELLLSHPYWSDVADAASPQADLPLEWLHAIARKVPSRFFTIDVARLRSGAWTVMELGDGQVSGLPSPSVAGVFYAGIAARLGA